MLRHGEVHLYIGFLSEIAPPGIRRAEFDFLRSLGEALGTTDVPVHWFLPPMLFEQTSPASYADLVSVLGERLDRGLDRLVAVGFRGAFHPLLGRREVERDLRWAVHNPWGTGTARAFRQPPVAVFPYHPDLARPGMLPLYRNAGFDTVAILCRPWRVRHYSGLWQEPETGLRFIPVIRASPETPGIIRSLARRSARSSEQSFMVLFGSLQESRSVTRELLGRLARRSTVRCHAWPEAVSTPQAVTAQELASMAPGALPCTPTARHVWLRAEPLRRSPRNTDARTLLGALSYREPAGAELTIPEGEMEIRPRLHTSVMPGAVTLGGEDFDARIDDGRLCGLARTGLPLFPMASVRTYLETPAGILPFTTESAASFEENGDRGLRAVLSGGEARLLIDYTFLASFPALFVDLHASYPTLPADCRTVVPFGISVGLGRGTASVTIDCISEDGAKHRRRVDPTDPPGTVDTVGGNAFVITAGGSTLSLSFPERRGLAFLPLQWTVLREGSSRVLVLNPFGTFHALEAPAYAATQERLTMVLSPEDTPPRLPRAALRACLEHRILRWPERLSRPPRPHSGSRR